MKRAGRPLQDDGFSRKAGGLSGAGAWFTVRLPAASTVSVYSVSYQMRPSFL